MNSVPNGHGENANHNHNHPFNEFRFASKKKLKISMVITIIFMFVEAIGGVLVGSIALINDAGHMFTHVFSIAIALVGMRIADQPSCTHKTYGLYRAEILTAFLNGLFLLGIAGFLGFEIVLRLINPEPIDSFYMIIVAIMGLVVNLISIKILQGSQKSDLNIQGVFTHMLADTASSIGVVIAGVIIYFTDWTILDPLMSIIILVFIVSWAWKVIRESSRILLEIAPHGVDTNIIIEDIKKNFPAIDEIFHMHLWTLTSDKNVVSFHITLKSQNQNDVHEEALIDKIEDFLYEKYKIIESTIQINTQNDQNACKF